MRAIYTGKPVTKKDNFWILTVMKEPGPHDEEESITKAVFLDINSTEQSIRKTMEDLLLFYRDDKGLNSVTGLSPFDPTARMYDYYHASWSGIVFEAIPAKVEYTAIESNAGWNDYTFVRAKKLSKSGGEWVATSEDIHI